MEASTRKAVAIGLAATCWVGAAGMSIADPSTLRDGVALGLILAGLLALLWGWWPAGQLGEESAVWAESAGEQASFSKSMKDASIKAVDAADRAAKSMGLDSVERAAGDFRAALAEIESSVKETPEAGDTIPLIQDLRRGSNPPYEFAQPQFKAKLLQLVKNRLVDEPPRASTTAGLIWRIIERGMGAQKGKWRPLVYGVLGAVGVLFLTALLLWFLPMMSRTWSPRYHDQNSSASDTMVFLPPDERFGVESKWLVDGNTRMGSASLITPRLALVAGPMEADFNAVVKLVDGRSVNGHFWGFVAMFPAAKYSGEVHIKDRESGAEKTFAIPVRGADPEREVSFLSSRDSEGGRPCKRTAHTLCLLQNRYMLQLDYQDRESHEWHPGLSLHHSDTSGFFAFSEAADYDWAVRAFLDPEDERYWFQASALTDVAWTLSIRDLVGGSEKRIVNRLGSFDRAVNDTQMFR